LYDKLWLVKEVTQYGYGAFTQSEFTTHQGWWGSIDLSGARLLIDWLYAISATVHSKPVAFLFLNGLLSEPRARSVAFSFIGYIQ
jgi:hypothetical protein